MMRSLCFILVSPSVRCAVWKTMGRRGRGGTSEKIYRQSLVEGMLEGVHRWR